MPEVLTEPCAMQMYIGIKKGVANIFQMINMFLVRHVSTVAR